MVNLSTIVYVDTAMRASAGKVDVHGNPSGCTNYTQWVFTQRITIGKSSIRPSAFGAPITSGANPVSVDSTTGKISLTDQVTNAGDVANFSAGINPYSKVGSTVTGLPSGQIIYIAEVASVGMVLPPFVPSAVVYSYNMF